MKYQTSVVVLLVLLVSIRFAAAGPDEKVYQNITDMPQIEKSVSPKYPEEARKQKQSGKVFLGFIVEKDGRVSAINVKKTSGFPLLDEAAITALKQYRFIPGKIDDKAVRVKLTIPIQFKLK